MTQDQALSILKTGANVFLTGEAGAGKTHTVNAYVAWLRSRGIEPAITASTGIAATHIHGMTLHSWSGIGVVRGMSDEDIVDIAKSRYVSQRIKKTKVLILDEVSMIDGETLSLVERVCRRVKKSPLPFGGMQVVFVGDFFQLPPVAKWDGRKAIFCFQSPAWRSLSPVVCYLTEQHRQEDPRFLEILSVMRRDEFGERHFEHIRSCLTDLEGAPSDVTRLFSHNADVDSINAGELAKLSGKTKVFVMADRGPEPLVDALKRGCLSPERLELREGAAVMFTKNNPNAGFANGTLGTVIGFDEESKCPVVMTRDERVIVVRPMEWAVEEEGEAIAKVMQIPLRLAWAITIHKSQGMSLDAAVMDLSRVFEFGQGYVALSRVRSLSGVYLLGASDMAFKVSPEILEQDALFHAQSEEAAKEYAGLSEEELLKRQKDFVGLCGGSWEEAGETKKDKAGFSFDAIRKDHPHAYRPWSEEEETKLKELFEKNTPTKKIAEALGRKSGAIRSRLKKLEMTRD
jgi:ATP-dependent DNA helicase PIF1